MTHLTGLNRPLKIKVLLKSKAEGSLLCIHLSFFWHLDQTPQFNGALDKYNIIPKLFPKKGWDFYISLEVLAWVMTACRVLSSRLTYFWRNMNISSIFYFSKSTSINTQYSSLLDTLKMMLFTKYLIKWKCIGRISWKYQYWFNSKSSTELDIKR